MARKGIELIISAKNKMNAGLSRAEAAMDKFAAGAAKVGKAVAKGFLAAGAAVAAFAAKALSAYAKQEKAEAALVAAMNAHGEAGKALLPSLRRVATEIQRQTGIADEQTLATMAQLRLLGVQTRQLGGAARGVIALGKAGMGQEAATRAMSAALSGNYTMLTRYIPALRDASTEAEKQALLQDFLTKGYAAQREELSTLSGQWGALKGNIGDVWEEFGRIIGRNEILTKALESVSKKVVEFGEKLSGLLDSGAVENLTFGFQHFGNEAGAIFKRLWINVKWFWGGMQDQAETGVLYVVNVFKAMGASIVADFKQTGAWIGAVWDKIKNPLSKFQAPDTSEAKAAAKDMWKAIRGGVDKVTDRQDRAAKERIALEEQVAARSRQISDAHAAALMANTDAVAKRKAEEAAAEEALAKSSAATRKAFDFDAAIASRKATQDTLRAELDAIAKRKAAIEGLAKSRVADVIEQRKQAKEAEKIAQDEEKRFARLQAKEKRGTRLSRQDKEFMDAARAIKAAQLEYDQLGGRESALNEQLEAAQKAVERMEEIRDQLKTIADQNRELLTAQ